MPDPLEPDRLAITYGTFDLFHIGHARLFQRIKARYGRLVVGVSTDAFNAVKGKEAVMPFRDRMEVVRACRWVDAVIPETHWGQKEDDIRRFRVDALVMGDDWQGAFDHFSSLCEVLYLPRTELVSSSHLKASVINQVERMRSRARYEKSLESLVAPISAGRGGADGRRQDSRPDQTAGPESSFSTLPEASPAPTIPRMHTRLEP